MEWIIANWLPMYLALGILFTAISSSDGNRSGVFANAVTGFLLPLYLFAMLFMLLVRGWPR